MKNLLLYIIVLILSNFIFAQSVDVRDSDSYILIQINDEGDAGGSITIPDATEVLYTDDKLYNIDSKLYWEGNELGMVAAAGGWTDVGTDVYLTTGTDEVGIGTETPQGALDVVSTTGALIVPRMTATQMGVLSEIPGSIIYNITDDQFYFYEGTAWVTK